eukprot:4668291-Amphidinium_carterae.1
MRVFVFSQENWIRIHPPMWYPRLRTHKTLRCKGAIIARYGLHDPSIEWDTTLSLGELQRIACARVIWQQPQLALLDEATSALDDKNEVELFETCI